MTALNSGVETFPGIDYTEIASHTDVFGPPEDAYVQGPPQHVTNIAVDELCPGHVADHLTLITFDPVAYALVLDALDHDGPADPHRVDPAVCAAVLPPTMQPSAVIPGYVTCWRPSATTRRPGNGSLPNRPSAATPPTLAGRAPGSEIDGRASCGRCRPRTDRHRTFHPPPPVGGPRWPVRGRDALNGGQDRCTLAAASRSAGPARRPGQAA